MGGSTKRIKTAYVPAGVQVTPRFLNGANERQCDVLFWSEAPGTEESQTGMAFVGPAGRLMQTLIEAELPGAKVRLDHVCPEWLYGRKPHKPQYEYYAERAQEIIRQCSPKVMVLLGEHPYRFFAVPPPIQPTRRNGETLTVKDVPSVLSVHPAYVLRSPKEISKLRMVFAVVKSLLRRPEKNDALIVSGADLAQRLKDCAKDEVAFDIETTSLNPDTCDLLTASFTLSDGSTFVAPFFHPQSPGSVQSNLKALKKWWAQGPRIVHNAKFECHFMQRLTGQMPDKLTDTMLLGFLDDENKPRGLDDLAVRHCKARPWWTDIKGSFSEIPLNKLAGYNAKDTEYTHKLNRVIRSRLTAEQQKVHDEILMPVTKVLVLMEQRGLKVDLDLMETNHRQLDRMIQQRKRVVQQEFPGLNVRSSLQMQELLFSRLGLKPIRKTKKGNPSADEETITHYAQTVPQLKTLGEMRLLQSLKSRIYEAWEEHIDDGYIHGSMDLGIAVNFRLACNNPNLQNMERVPDEETKEGAWLRKLSPRKLIHSRHKDGCLLQLDYSANQLRLMATVANVKPMIEAFEKGVDVHELTRVKLEPILRKHVERRIAKNANFTLLFEGTEYALYLKYGIPKTEGRELKEAWYKAYPEIPAYHQWTEQFIRKHQYIENCFGTRRHLPLMKGRGKEVDKHNRAMFRQGCNYPISSPEALLIYMAMIEIEEEVPHDQGELILQVHDSLVLDCPSVKAAKKAAPLCQAIMIRQGQECRKFTRGRLDRPIPLKVDVKIGETL